MRLLAFCFCLGPVLAAVPEVDPALDGLCAKLDFSVQASIVDVDALLASAPAWEDFPERGINLGYSKASCWLRLRLVNTRETPRELLLQLAYPLLDEITLFRRGARAWERTLGGDRLPFSQRPFAHRTHVLPLELRGRSTETVYVCIRSTSTIPVRPRLWSPEGLRAEDESTVPFLWGLYGFLVCLITACLILAQRLREKLYILLAMHSLFLTLFALGQSGVAGRYLWPEQVALAHVAQPVCVGLFSAFLLAFAHRFIRLEEVDRAAGLVVRILVGVNIAAAAFGLIAETRLGVSCVATVAGLNVVVLLAWVLPVTAFVRRNRDARILFLAFALFLGAGFLRVLWSFDLVPSGFWSQHAYLIGGLLELFVLSIALADRVQRMSLEVAALNAELESKVKERTASLEEARDQAEAASRAKSIFLANVSHEIRTPLNGVIGLTEMALKRGGDPLLERIRGAARLLLSTVNGILDFSKIEAGKLQLEEIPFDVWTLFEDCACNFAGQAHAKGVLLRLELLGELPQRLVGDPVRLRQVVVNLLGNAVKFTAKGEIVLRVRGRKGGRHHTRFAVEVADTGIGIPRAKLRTITEAFTQVDSSTTRRYGGTGLGLAIASRLVQAMGGRLTCESEEGRGSTFSFDVRLPHTELDPWQPDPCLQGARAWLLESHPARRAQLAALLRDWGMEVAAPEEPQEAETRFGEGVVLLDASLPEPLRMAIGRAVAGSRARLLLLEPPLLGDARPDGLWLERPLRRQQLHETLRRAIKASPSARVEVVPARPKLRAATVLVVDDEPLNRMVVRMALEERGLEVREADNGRTALESYQTSSADLVLMDLRMPEMDGLEAARRLRALSYELPIVALTAQTLQGEEEGLRRAGFDSHLGKPLDFAALDALLHQHLAEVVE